MATIRFDRWTQKTRFHNPLKAGLLDEQDIEIRLDPLTGHQSVFNAALEDKASVLFHPTDRLYLQQRVVATQKECFLCGDRWSTTTPRYPEDLVSGGRLMKGEAVLFPNLFPLAAYHAVVMLGASHFRSLDDFPASLLQDAFEISIQFIRRCMEKDPQGVYFTINANYLLPAGASVMHPHFQILGSPLPYTHHRLLMDCSARHFRDTGMCYWVQLASEERNLGQRWIGESGTSRWFAAFSPLGANEVNGVWPEARSFSDWDAEDVRGLSEALSRILRGYHALGYSTFNFSCFSGPVDRASPEFRCIFRVIVRQNVAEHYRTDDYYLQKLLQNELVVQRPENLASLMRAHFSNDPP